MDTPTDEYLSPLDDDDLTDMLLIREFELNVLELFAQGHVSGTTHTCIGQEYISVAVAPLLVNDMVFSNHRGHGHYLSRFRDPDGLLAEITGRVGAICGGVGGSQHILRDGYMSTGIQGESLPVAVGAALHFARAGTGQIAAAFIGDGTWGEGSVYEALNMAQLWKAPLLVIVENNGIAQSTPLAANMAGSIAGRTAGFGIGYHYIDTIDVVRIRESLTSVVASIRATRHPAVVEFRTDRVGPHSKGDDTRDAAARAEVESHDWLHRYRAAYPDRVSRIESQQRALIADLSADVLSRELTTWRPR